MDPGRENGDGLPPRRLPDDATAPNEWADTMDPSPAYDPDLTQPCSPEPQGPATRTFAPGAQAHGLPRSGLRFAPGHRIGSYVIEQRLGGGGMGEVYAAEHLTSGHRLAVKFLASSETWSTSLRARFLREGELAATVNHPNSVYVYGTEEVDGIPLIAMELALGGTLQDVVQDKGPLAVADAVDATLQIVAGLEAAYKAGVLHRDVKPANCFVDERGNVKIGDFGLSFPTAAAEDTRLTMTGSVLATPAFAPPEQLRGEDVDVRADLYAVGATLYNLLTGKTPLQAPSAMQMLAAVLEKRPESPSTLRPEIPQGLSRIVLRCLEKRPADRYQSYAELRRALMNYSSRVPLPAPTKVRIWAGVFDYLLYGLLCEAATPLLRDGLMQENHTPILLLAVAIGFVYAIPEMLWGRSLGKHLFGLRLSLADGRVPGYAAILKRTAVFVGVIVLPDVSAMLSGDGSFAEAATGFMALGAPLLLFVGGRHGRSWRGLHDRSSGTHVVVARRGRMDSQMRAPTAVASDPLYQYALGPFRVRSDPAQSPTGRVLEGYDARLRRRVWVFMQSPGAPAMSMVRRNLARRTRLRWLTGRRETGLAWDAFEAPSGQSLFAGDRKPAPWSDVRRWLMDLAEEIRVGLPEDPAGEVFAPERVWITELGGVMILDFAPPEVTDPARDAAQRPLQTDECVLVRGFLTRVARRALFGAAEPAGDPLAPPAMPLPLSASRFLTRLASGHFESGSAVLEDLHVDGHRLDSIGRRRRVVQFAVAPLLLIGLLMLDYAATGEGEKAVEREHPGYQQALACLDELRALEWRRDREGADERRRDLMILLAGPLRSVIADTAATGLVAPGRREPIYKPRHRDQIRKAIKECPQATAEDVAAAQARIGTEFDQAGLRMRARNKLGLALKRVLYYPLVAAPLAVIFGVALRGGLLMSLLQIAVVNRRGRVASRWRILARSCVTWSPFLLPWLMALGGLGDILATALPGERIWAGGRAMGGVGYNAMQIIAQLWGLPVVLFVPGAIYAIVRPNRGIQDRLTGTYLVPR